MSAKTAAATTAVAPPSECSICVENFNASTRKLVQCCYCEFSACRKCVKSYLLDRIEYATCMNCNKEWSRNFLVKNLEKTFITKAYKSHREDILFDREKSFMIATMPIVERLKILENDKKEISELTRLIGTLQAKLYDLETVYRRNKDLENPYMSYEEYMNAFSCRNRGAGQPTAGADAAAAAATETTHKHFVRKCTYENCRGFLSTQWKCGLCENWTCPDCFEVRGPDKNAPHECNKDNLETAKLIRSDTRNCPKCGEGIYKIEGCDQMFCTSCHTAFSWKTGVIVTNGNIHNPHYYEWQRRVGNNERTYGDFECGRQVTHRVINNVIYYLDAIKFTSDKYVRSDITNRMRNIIHFHAIVMPGFRIDVVQENQDLRIKYLMNEITEAELKSALQKREKRFQYNKEMNALGNTYVTVSTDLALKIEKVVRIETREREGTEGEEKMLNIKQQIILYMEEWDAFIEYVNTYLEDISITFNTVKYLFENGEYMSITQKNRKMENNKKDDRRY
jgi:hypothetical protein